jgi:hypothetical protein
LSSGALRGFIAQRPATEGSEVERRLGIASGGLGTVTVVDFMRPNTLSSPIEEDDNDETKQERLAEPAQGDQVVSILDVMGDAR